MARNSSPLGDPDGVAGADPARAQHLGVDAGARLGIGPRQRADPVVAGEHPEGFGVAGQVAVGQGGHGASRGPGDHAQDEFAADLQVPAEPVVLGEARGLGPDDDVRAVAFSVGPLVGAELSDPAERRGGEQVQRREIDEGARRGGRAQLH